MGHKPTHTTGLELIGISFAPSYDDGLWEAMLPWPAWAAHAFHYNRSRPGVVPLFLVDVDASAAVHRAALAWLLPNLNKVHKACLAAVAAHYKSVRDDYEDALEDEFAERMPKLSSARDLLPLTGCVAVFIHPYTKRELPYIGVQMNCSWEREHGLGVMLHGSSAIAVGGADNAFLSWVANKHANA